jgi:hypothetical protein
MASPGGSSWHLPREVHFDPTFFPHLYLRLLEAGKPKKLALVACIWRLLTILNTMMRTGT